MIRGSQNTRRGFTVIELLVVIAIIALLMAILLPSLSKARLHAKTVMCASNMHHISLAVADYLLVSKGTYPASYLYPLDDQGSWTVKGQTKTHPHGYLHWSYFLYDTGQVDDKAFQCPMMDMGGIPRTNPGLKQNDWVAGQVDQNGQTVPNELEDKQAPFMSYTANAAIMPRNKFTKILSGGKRVNNFVTENRVRRVGDTILMAEFLDNWKAIAVEESGNLLVKSHRPINPFYHVGSGFDEYQADVNSPGYMYGLPNDQDTYGLLPLAEVRNKRNILDHSSGISQINAVGRHHPTADRVYRAKYGGESNFLFCDGHAESLTPLKSVQERKWGDFYYSVSGANEIINMLTITRTGGRP